jgi:ribosomal-protein-alanine N-acetyltransferase
VIQSATLSDPNPDLLAAAVSGPLCCLVAVDAGPVGYLLAIRDDERAYLPELVVAPDRQNEGIGTTLLSAGCDRLEADGIDAVRVTARASDNRARRFYEQRAFETVERVPGHYSDGTAGIVYERRL